MLSLPDYTEHVYVCIVGGKINEGHSGSLVQPQVVYQFLEYGGAVIFCAVQVLDVSCSAVCGQQAPVRGTFDLLLSVVGPTAKVKN